LASLFLTKPNQIKSNQTKKKKHLLPPNQTKQKLVVYKLDISLASLLKTNKTKLSYFLHIKPNKSWWLTF